MAKNQKQQNNKYKSCAFTGPRPGFFSFGYDEKHPDCQIIKKGLAEEINRLCLEGSRTFYCGGAMGVDMWCGEIVLHLKEIYKDLKLIIVVPFKGQADKWPATYRKRYENLLKNSDEVIILHNDFAKKYYLERNRYMVDNCDLLVAICNKDLIDSYSSSGTYYTIKYAYKTNKKILILNLD